jgi:hypothetical protein
LLALEVSVKDVLLAIDETVPMVDPPCVWITEPTLNSVKNDVPEPVNVVEEVEEDIVPVLLMLVATQAVVELQLAELPEVVTVPPVANTSVDINNSKAIDNVNILGMKIFHFGMQMPIR